MAKVMTLNTHSWMETETELKFEQLVSALVKADYDVIALQEVNQLLDSKPAELDAYFQALTDQRVIHQDNFAYCLIKQLKAHGLNYYWSWTASHIGYDKYAEGSAIFSKAPIKPLSLLVSLEKDFSDYHTRQILIGETKLMNQTVRVVSGHYSWWVEDRASGFAFEWDNTLKYLAKGSTPIILMGDLNNAADIEGEGYAYVKQTAPDLQDAFTIAETTDGQFTVENSIDGWEGNNQQLRIDYILLSNEFKVKRYRVIFDGRLSPVISDHFGVEAEIY